MKHLPKLITIAAVGASLSACVYVNDTSGVVAEEALREARLDGGSYKALRVSDPIYDKVANVATQAAYDAAPTRRLVEQMSVMQSANGDYIAHVVMSGGDANDKYRLVVVEVDRDGAFVSRGVILH